MDNRKYFKYRIVELEEIYNGIRDDYATLEELEEELTYRSTKRARELRQKVKNHLSEDITMNNESASNNKQDLTNEKINWDTLIKDSLSRPVNEKDILNSKPLENNPEDIIDSWTVIECLSPQSYKRPEDLVFGLNSLAYIHNNKEPWFNNEKAKPKYQLYYIVYLGSIKLEPATEQLLKRYQDKRIERPDIKGMASLGVIILDKKGIPIPDKGLSLSSFGWAYSRALQGNLDDLKHWEVAEENLKEKLSEIIYKKDDNENPIPLSFQQIIETFDCLVKNCEIPLQDVIAPSFVIRVQQSFNKGEPESPLLNSFYLDDLQRVKKSLKTGDKGRALNQYLGIEKVNNYCDILKDKRYIEEALQPKNSPVGKWPGKGRHPLVLLQQTAINLATKDLKYDGLSSVNGPPGTGKTTLLRDIISSVIVKRAIALSKFKNSDDAFTHAGQIKAGNGFVHLYKLDNSLLGHEIVVASSNNKAVENISRELPLRSEIDEDLVDFNYFKTISDSLLQEDNSSWGLISAVLGNSKNKNDFINKAWWDDNTGLRKYFLSFAGHNNTDEEVSKIIQECNPPINMEEAKQRWLKARQKFEKDLKKSEKAIASTQLVYEYQKEIRFLNNKLLENKLQYNKSEEKINLKHIELENTNKALIFAKSILDNNIELEKKSVKVKPGFFKRIFARREWKRWDEEHKILTSKLSSSKEEYTLKKNDYNLINKDINEEKSNLIKLELEYQQLANKIKTLQAAIEEIDIVSIEKLVTESTWNLSHEEQQKFTPNFSEEVQRLRDNVFVSAMELHKAFIDVSAKQIRQNLGAFMGCLSGRKLPHEKNPLLPHLWASFFLLTPVVSTAFASVGRMLKDLPSESIGWLLIDEAGQATPQAAIGAIHRSKRVLSVGDPLQIEPVVTMPPSLIESFSKHYGVDHNIWMAPDASVQTLSDNSNKYGTSIPRDLSEIKIGIPLLVHRRCEEPMFSISNKLAYAGLMVHATIPKPSRLTNILGKSQWFDICGSSQEKWSPEEGDFVLDMLLQAASQMQETPNVFVISPFKLVAEKMRQKMRENSLLFESHGISDVNYWIQNSVGTVHTFQGKEAETVVFLLGAPSPTQNGARSWATSNVNLLNVAVSRAKQNFYIVGNKSLWAETGHMKIINRLI